MRKKNIIDQLQNNSEQNTSLIEIIHIGCIYKHYKGNFYKILTVARDTTDLSWIIIYECLYKNPVS